jgi:hypothetical protein
VGGCDSTVTLNLTINQPTAFTINQSACNTFTLNGQTYTSSGTYTQILANANGCDSTITLNLQINYPTYETVSLSACDSLTLNGQIYYASGTYTQTLINAAGCDSILTINATINYSTTSSSTQSACDTFALNGQVYTSTGIYTQQFINAAGCDSILILNLTITQSTGYVMNQTSCRSYTLNGQTYNTSGTYTQTFVNAGGCDSVLTLQLTVNTANVAVTQTGPSLTSNATSATYQWMSCNPYQNLVGEINQSYTATSNGDYAVAVTQNGCTDTSACYSVNGIGNTDFVLSSNIIFYPNPVAQLLIIENDNGFSNANVKILSVAGQMVYEERKNSSKKIILDMSKLVSGIYFIEIEQQGYKVVKVVTKE